jgi:hypothetical protein
MFRCIIKNVKFVIRMGTREYSKTDESWLLELLVDKGGGCIYKWDYPGGI